MKNLVLLPDELLYQRSEPVENIDAEVRELAAEMLETMREARGIGLAGVQVGELRRLFVCQDEDEKPWVFINPSILETSLQEVKYEEGCLSIPGIYSDVKRPAVIKVQAWNERGRPFQVEADGMFARVILHEYDHLNGVLFLNHLSERKREKLLKQYSAQRG
ncbi:peptide deformylase [Spirochaeta africana]|uniref:Peptide deformylase n=1 Tax=Spirochaeta africana (strain ATCC 700263 / DSM 8902 / Z-7692) TaxID=889378 RepID=H9UI34_SPIAZ|nr:peptide deformylase [Spirochaeta africana]AFG37177.1 peptide deformylase [Spirochaeta africana DSM 8902]